MSLQATGQKYEFLCCFVFHIANGKIDRVHEYFDMDTVKRQLGTAGIPHAPHA
jgi:ketosteroid isomerase-like protein